MEFLKIWLLCTIAAVIYGILHDQITARVCVEYFSMAHPTILPLTSPTLLGLEWGILATWWVGCGLGLLLATSARLGSLPSLSARDLSHSIRLLLLSMAFCALLAGITGFLLTKASVISLQGPLAEAIPASKHARFMADAWAHLASYFIGGCGGLALCIRAYARRKRLASSPG
jgi:hypothetical protein